MAADPFFMQWHITDRCNLSCGHCYRDAAKPDVRADDLAAILEQFEGFLQRHQLRGRINFSGGEPLLEPERLLWLTELARERGISTRVLTNGTLLTPGLARSLVEAGCEVAQVSIDGPPEVHDRQRGDGTFARAIEGAGHARRAGLSATLSMPAADWNYRHLDRVAAIAEEHFDRLFIHRLAPCGGAVEQADHMLSRAEWQRVARWCVRQSRKPGGVQVALRDPTFGCFSKMGDDSEAALPGGCSAGFDGLAVEANGDVYPCRRLPLVVGSLLTESIDAVWASGPMARLRDRDGLTGRCGRCERRWRCGGCRAIAWAVSGSIQAEDPQCFHRPRRSLRRTVQRRAEGAQL